MAITEEVALIISAKDLATAEMRKLQKSGERAGKGVEKSAVQATKKLDLMGGAARKARLALGSIFAGITIGGGIRALANFEQGLIGVEKTTGLSGDALEAFGDRIQGLSARVKVGTTELLSIAQAAGQLGVTGADNLERFTDTVARLGLASDLQGEVAATTLARLLNITGESVETVGRLGSVIVSLGNQFAATEAQIARHATEVAAATAAFNISSAEAAALGTVLASMGIRAQLGGAVIGRTFRTISEAVAKGGKELLLLERIMERSGKQIEESFGRDPLGTFVTFVEGLRRLAGEGNEVSLVLESIGLSGDELNKVLPVLAKRLDVLGEAIADSNRESSEQQALFVESEKAAQSLKAAFVDLGSAAAQFATDVGGTAAAKETVGFFARTFRSLGASADAAREQIKNLFGADNEKELQASLRRVSDSLNTRSAAFFAKNRAARATQLDAFGEDIEKAIRLQLLFARAFSGEAPTAAPGGGDFLAEAERLAAFEALMEGQVAAAQKAGETQLRETERNREKILQAIERARVKELQGSKEGLAVLRSERLADVKATLTDESELFRARATIRQEFAALEQGIDDKSAARVQAQMAVIVAGRERVAEAAKQSLEETLQAERDHAAERMSIVDGMIGNEFLSNDRRITALRERMKTETADLRQALKDRLLSIEEFNEQRLGLEEEFAESVAAFRARELEEEGTFGQGIIEGLKNIQDETATTFTQARDLSNKLGTTVIDRLAGGFGAMVANIGRAKISWQDFARTLLADLARIAAEQAFVALVGKILALVPKPAPAAGGAVGNPLGPPTGAGSIPIGPSLLATAAPFPPPARTVAAPRLGASEAVGVTNIFNINANDALSFRDMLQNPESRAEFTSQVADNIHRNSATRESIARANRRRK